jgi:hypothetical protein
MRAAGRQGSRESVPLRRRDRARTERIITGGHNNKAARAISFRQEQEINAPALTAMLEQITANNRAGGWRKLSTP